METFCFVICRAFTKVFDLLLKIKINIQNSG